MNSDQPDPARPSPTPGGGGPGEEAPASPASRERPHPEPEHPEEPSPTAEPEEPSPTAEPGALDFLTMGTAIVLCLVLGGGIGYLLDDVVHTAPVLTFVGLALGVAGAVAVTVSHVRRFL